jgi:hypothetical protein
MHTPVNMPTALLTGSSTGRVPDGSALYGRYRHSTVTALVASSIASYYAPAQSAAAIRGSVAGGPGFTASWGFGICDVSDSYQATGRIFCGLRSTFAAPTDVAINTLPNLIGVGAESGDANLRLFIRAAAVAGVDLGAAFPVGVAGMPELYVFTVVSPPGNDTAISWRLDSIRTGATASGAVAAPGITNVLLYELLARSSGTLVPSVSAVAFWGMRLERSGYQP